MDNVSRTTAGITAIILLTSIGYFTEGLKNSSIDELKHKWIRNEVKDIQNSDFARLDEEEPPRPLIPKSNVAKFKEEFERKYMQ